MKKVIVLFLIIFVFSSFSSPSYRMARMKYHGGGDWYSSRTALTNLIEYCNQELNTNFYPEEALVEPGSSELFNYPFVFLTGHGNITFTDAEAENLRMYLEAGGFLHICDNYGMNDYVRIAMKKVFPDNTFVELPYDHPIYKKPNVFKSGLPKIHEHDGKKPQGFGIIYKGRLVCFYDYECDLGNGWEDLGTYPNDSKETHEKALKMGANIIHYALTN